MSANVPLPARLRANFRPRERLSVWSLRLLFGAVLMTFSEIIMWQNPPAHTLPEWLARAVLYLCLASITLDLAVRGQAREIGGLVLLGGVYGLLASATVGRDIFNNLPANLLVRGMGLQTGAGLYGLLAFVLIMQGRALDPRALLVAAAVGALWGIWVKWYPVQTVTGWGPMTIEVATTWLIGALVVTGALFLFVGPRFRVVKETSLLLEWWEAILVGAPLFVSLLIGLADERIIPFLPFVLVAGLLAIIVGALFVNRKPNEPSYLANITFAAPNLQNFVFLAIAFVVAATFASLLVTDGDSPFGVAVYWIIVAAGSLWLPAASALIGIRAYRAED